MRTKNEIAAVIGYINLGGVGFSVNAEYLLEKRKVYSLKLKSSLPQKDVEVSVKVAIIEIEKSGNCRFCRAVYRHLSDMQISGLKEIIGSFESDSSVVTGMMSAVTIR